MRGAIDEKKPKDKKKGRHVIKRETKIVWKYQYAKDFRKSINRKKKRRPPASMEGFDERISVPAKVPTPDLSSSEESVPSFCRARNSTRGEQAMRGGKKLHNTHSFRYELGNMPDRTNLTQTSCLNPSTTYPTADTAFPEVLDDEFEDAVESVQDLRTGTPPEYYWMNESLAEVTNDGLEEAAEDSRDHLMRPFDKHPPIR